jgi:5-methylcytosine-specific restriction endonuclease McrA
MPEGSISTRLRRQVAERARRRCEYCLSPADYAPDPFSVDDIVPRVRGGNSRLSNLAYSCQACNNHKYISTTALDPVSGETVPLYNPRHHLWRDHFTWSEDSVRLVGLTPIGRAAIDRLRLNRPSVVNLRRLLLAVGQHPPREAI